MDGMVGVIIGRSHGLPEAGSQIVNVRPNAKAESPPGPGVRNIPLPQLRPRLSEIDSSQLVLKICQMGKMSYPAAHTLQQNCFDAHSIIGGAHLNP